MKKIISITIIIIILLGISSILIIKKPIDYTNLKENDLFMKSFTDYYTNYYKEKQFYSKPFSDSKTDNYCLFKVLDNNDKPIKDYEITFYDTFNNDITLKTNQEGYTGISDLELKTYNFKTKDMSKSKEINLKENICNFTLKGDNITFNKQGRITLESEEKKLIQDSITYNLDEQIFIKDDFKGEKLSIITTNDIIENNTIKREFNFNITNSYIKKIEIILNTLNTNQEVLNLKNKKQNIFTNEEGFIIKENKTKEFSNTNINLLITFEHNNKTYKIKKTITLQNNTQSSSLYVRNSSDNDLKIEINQIDFTTNKETNIYSAILKSKRYVVAPSIDFGTFVVKTYLNDKLYYLKYIDIKKDKLTYLQINEGLYENSNV